MQQYKEEFQRYYDHVTPLLDELFNMAHVITGNYELAEYVLLQALADMWRPNKRLTFGLRDALRNQVVRFSLEQAKLAQEMTWEPQLDASEHDVARQLLRESTLVQRAVYLRMGCNLSYSDIATCIGGPETTVRDMIENYTRRLVREFNLSTQSYAEGYTAEFIHKVFEKPDRAMPSVNMIFRSLETELSKQVEVEKKRSFLSRVLGLIATLLMTAICVVAFWLIAVLLQKDVKTPESAATSQEIQIFEEEVPTASSETEAPASPEEEKPVTAIG